MSPLPRSGQFDRGRSSSRRPPSKRRAGGGRTKAALSFTRRGGCWLVRRSVGGRHRIWPAWRYFRRRCRCVSRRRAISDPWSRRRDHRRGSGCNPGGSYPPPDRATDKAGFGLARWPQPRIGGTDLSRLNRGELRVLERTAAYGTTRKHASRPLSTALSTFQRVAQMSAYDPERTSFGLLLLECARMSGLLF